MKFTIDPGDLFFDVQWAVQDPQGEFIEFGDFQNGGAVTRTFCFPKNGCYTLIVFDFSGDGLQNGSIQLFSDGVLTAENPTGVFGQFWNGYANCQPGTVCGTAAAVDTGQHVAPNPDFWYAFSPADTGTFRISTCGLPNGCDTKIWVYDHCGGLVSEDQLGSIFYNNDGCGGGTASEAQAFLAAGKDYFIRIGDNGDDCAGQPIAWRLEYLGPVVGCMDPTACNFNPLATIADTNCTYLGAPDCLDGPDLVVVQNTLENSLFVSKQFNADQCLINEGCIRGYGERWLLNFSTHIRNIGTRDYLIGETPADPAEPSDQFEWDECHDHWHYRGYAEYLLFDATNKKIPIGTKNGFCVLDLECDNGSQGQFSCQYMGITAGCGDIYDTGLPCQWVDVTDVPDGDYTLVVRVNWDNSPDALGRFELRHDNNWAQVCIRIERDATGEPSVEVVSGPCAPVTDCLGVAYGSAVVDCAGECDGKALAGDRNTDGERKTDDVLAYVAESLADSTTSAACRDLFSDGKITVYDAALLNECILHGGDASYWEARFPCEFPTGVSNPDDIVYLLPGELNETEKYFDVLIVNPFSRLFALEFSIKGLKIQSVVDLDPVFSPLIQHDGKGQIAVLSLDETALGKNILPKKWLRVFYSELTATEVCVEKIDHVVNTKYEASNALVADPSCVQSTVSTTDFDEKGQNFGVFVHPNPFVESAEIHFPNPEGEPFSFEMIDAQGRVVRRFDSIRTEFLRVSRGDLPAGVYFFRLAGKAATAGGKLIAR